MGVLDRAALPTVLRAVAARAVPRLAGHSLRRRLRALLLASALLPTALLGAASLALVVHLGAATEAAGNAALRARSSGRLQAQAEQAAQPLGAALLGVEQQAAVLSEQSNYILSNPVLFPGAQQGNTPFTRLPNGSMVNTDPTVGVFAPAAAASQPGFWSQVSLLTHVDPLLRSMASVSCCLQPVVRYWIQAPDGLVRTDPNPGFAAGRRLRAQAALLAYYARQNPRTLRSWQRTVWTLPYADPAAAGSADAADPEIVSAVAPVYTAAGSFAGLAGADVAVGALQADLQAVVGTPFSAALLYLPLPPGGAVPSPPYPRATGRPLQAVVIARTPAAMPGPAAFGVPSGAAGTASAGSVEIAYAPVGVGGWMLAEAAPEPAADGATVAEESALGRRVAGTEAVAAGTLLAVTVALGFALAVLAEQAAATVSEPLQRLAAGIRRTAGEGDSPEEAPASRRARRLERDADEVAVLGAEFAALHGRLAAAVRRWRSEAEERARAETTALREKQRIALDIHDTLAQTFLSIVLLGEGAAGRLGQVADLARQGLRQARRSIAELSAQAEEAQGEPFVAAVREEAAAFPRTLPDPPAVTVEVDGWPEVPLPVQVALLGVLRAALGNVREHAGASAVRIRLRGLDDAAVLEVADNGRGFVAATVRPGQERGRGLPGMRQRLAEVGGALVVESRPGAGTVVRAIVTRDEPGAPDGGASACAL